MFYLLLERDGLHAWGKSGQLCFYLKKKTPNTLLAWNYSASTAGGFIKPAPTSSPGFTFEGGGGNKQEVLRQTASRVAELNFFQCGGNLSNAECF